MPIDASDVTFTQSGAGSSQRSVDEKLREHISVGDKGILNTGVDQTAALVGLMATLADEGFRGVIYIPYGTAFDIAAVYRSVPPGVILDDESSVNFGQPPGYKNRVKLLFSGDSESDDTRQMLGSQHHPSFTLMNIGTAGSPSADKRYASLYHAVGFNGYPDQITARQILFSQAPGKSAWRMALLRAVPYDAAMGVRWKTGVVVTSGSSVCYYGNNYYVAASTGTTGSTPPTHTNGSASDGGVSWAFKGAYLQAGTDFYVDTDGEAGFAFSGDLIQKFIAGPKTYAQTYYASGDVRLYNLTDVKEAYYWSSGANTMRFPKVLAGPGAAADTAMHLNSGGFGPALTLAASSATGRKYQWGVTASGCSISDTAAGAERWAIDAMGNFVPGADNAYSIGKSGARCAQIWATNATIQTSDARQKSDVRESDLGLEFIQSLRPVSYRLLRSKTLIDAIEAGVDENGVTQYVPQWKDVPGVRTHYGLVAQDVKAALGERDFAGFVHDTDTDQMGLRYEEFIAPLIKAIQELNSELKAAKEEIRTLREGGPK